MNNFKLWKKTMMWRRALIDWAVCLVCSSLLSNHNDNISTRRSVLIIHHPFSLKHPHDLFLPHLFLFSFFFFTSFFDIFHTFSLLPILPNHVHPSAGGGAWSIRINSGNSDVLTDSKKIFAKKKSERNLCKGFVPQNHQHYWCRQEPPQVFCTLQSKRDHQI